MAIPRPQQYTLFVDESGDFGSSRTSCYGAVLVPGDLEEAEKFLKQHVAHTLKAKYPDVLPLSKLHASELNAQRRANAYEILNTALLASVNSKPSVHYIAVAGSRGATEAPDQFRKRLFADFLGLLSALPVLDGITEQLRIIKATVTIHSQDKYTAQDVAENVDYVRSLIADGMASIRILEAFPIEQHVAHGSGGLALADFISNRVHNRHHAEASEALNQLEGGGHLTFFHSPASMRYRRAAVAERDGDYVLALVLWSEVDELEDDERAERMLRILRRVGQQSNHAVWQTSEAAIERVWREARRRQDYRPVERFVKQVDVLLPTIKNHLDEYTYRLLKYRLKGMELLTLNHRAGAATDVLTEIKKREHSLLPGPDTFRLVLQTRLREQILYEDHLEMEKAELLAERVYESFENFVAMWDLLLDHEAAATPLWKTQDGLRATSSLIRARLARGGPKHASEALQRLKAIPLKELSGNDRSRLVAYQFWALTNCELYDEVFSFWENEAEETLQRGDRYVIAAALKGAGNAVLQDPGAWSSPAHSLLKRLYDMLPLLLKDRHPDQLIYRDLALLQHQLSWKKGEVQHYLNRSGEITKALDNKPVKLHLTTLLGDHARVFGYGNSFRKRVKRAVEALKEMDKYQAPLGTASTGKDLLKLRQQSIY